MATYINSDILENILPALQALGDRELKPLGNLRVYRIRKAFMAHGADVEAIRRDMIRHRATPGEDGKLVLDIAGNVIFDQDPAIAADKWKAFVAAFDEILAGTFEFDLTISLVEHIGENIPPGNVLLGLGDLLVLPKEPGESEESELERPDAAK